jgi:predicted ATPase
MILACPGAVIYSFDTVPAQRVNYEDTEHYKIYKSFMENPKGYF